MYMTCFQCQTLCVLCVSFSWSTTWTKWIYITSKRTRFACNRYVKKRSLFQICTLAIPQEYCTDIHCICQSFSKSEFSCVGVFIFVGFASMSLHSYITEGRVNIALSLKATVDLRPLTIVHAVAVHGSRCKTSDIIKTHTHLYDIKQYLFLS